MTNKKSQCHTQAKYGFLLSMNGYRHYEVYAVVKRAKKKKCFFQMSYLAYEGNSWYRSQKQIDK